MATMLYLSYPESLLVALKMIWQDEFALEKRISLLYYLILELQPAMMIHVLALSWGNSLTPHPGPQHRPLLRPWALLRPPYDMLQPSVCQQWPEPRMLHIDVFTICTSAPAPAPPLHPHLHLHLQLHLCTSAPAHLHLSTTTCAPPYLHLYTSAPLQLHLHL